jgi:hypothetical protein
MEGKDIFKVKCAGVGWMRLHLTVGAMFRKGFKTANLSYAEN